MGAVRKISEAPSLRRPPATTPEGREDQMVALSVDLAERQLIDGTASAQVITHFLKLGSTREKLEQEKLRKENLLLESRANAIESGARVEELMTEAMRAFRGYSGNPDPEDRYEG
jgi:hypothetical protein